MISKIACKLVHDGAAGSPYAMHLISRELRRQPLGAGSQTLLAPEVFFAEVCGSLFVCRIPANTVAHLDNIRQAVANLEESGLGLCGLAIMRAVYKRDWQTAEAAFRAALDRAQESPIPFLPEAIAGLTERFLLLPRDGRGTRSSGSSTDLLWMANRAEEHFCSGRLREAIEATDCLGDYFPTCGWVTALRVRCLIVAGQLEAARSLLVQAELGLIPAGDGLAWENLLNGLLTKGANDIREGGPRENIAQHYRIPLCFQGLARICRGDRASGQIQLDRAAHLGEPAALMRNFDPVARYGAGLAVGTEHLRPDTSRQSPLPRRLAKVG